MAQMYWELGTQLLNKCLMDVGLGFKGRRKSNRRHHVAVLNR